jgi:hypothetical protein
MVLENGRFSKACHSSFGDIKLHPKRFENLRTLAE